MEDARRLGNVKICMLAGSGGGGDAHGIPSGGASGQILTKNSSADYDASWGYNNMDTLSLTDIPTPTSGNRWTITTAINAWSKSDEYYGTLISLSVYKAYRSIRIFRNSYNIIAGVAFLKTDNRVVGETPDYSVGWDKVVWFGTNTTLDYVDIPIPSDANYLFVYMNSDGTVYTPDKIDFIGRDELDFVRTIDAMESPDIKIANGTASDVLKIATYNIGHFSGGGYPDSSATYTARLSEYKQLIYNTINPDIMGVNEYSANMVNKGNTAQVLFGEFQLQYEGVQRNYSCNALFGNACLRNIVRKEFECLEDETITHTTGITAQDYYYLDADLYMSGRLVKVVTAHLAFDTNRPGVLQNKQIAELIAAYSNYDRVLMMGDWNVSAFSEFNAFTSAGYTLGNDGTYKTYDGNRALDNIIVKGLTVSNTGIVSSDLSDHLPFYCEVSVPSDERVLFDFEFSKSDLNSSTYSGGKNLTSQQQQDVYSAKAIKVECYYKNSAGLYCLVDIKEVNIKSMKAMFTSFQIRGMYSYLGTIGMLNWYIQADNVAVQLDQNFYNAMNTTTKIRIICREVRS